MTGFSCCARTARFVALGVTLMMVVMAMGSATATAQGNVAVESGVHDRYIVVFNNEVGNPRAAAASLARQHGFDVRMTYSTALKGFAASLPDRAVAALSRDRRVAYIEADQLAHTTAQTVPTGIARIFAPDNTNIGVDGIDDLRVDADVAVIDTGVAAHADINLAGKVDCTGGALSQNCTVNAGDDGNGHGTHVAGTIGAIDNGFGVVGVAPGVRIHAVKVLKDNGSGWISNIIGGIDWVTNNGAISVANMSLGGGNSDALCDAVETSIAAGVVHVVAAGNSDADAANSSPANCAGAITVSALADFNGLPGGGGQPTCRTDQDDTLANFSNWGSTVDIAAPGVCILSTWNNGSYATISGTSMAAPHVAGAAALLASAGMLPALIPGELIGAGNDGWFDDSGDVEQEPLLDVSSFAPAFVDDGGGDGFVNTLPEVAIDSPADTAEFDLGETITFNGTAMDAEDLDITASLNWSSTLDLDIGSGGSFNTSSLSEGTHTLTASVTDLDGGEGSSEVTITVVDPSTPPPEGGSMHVGAIDMGVRGRHLDVTVTVVESDTLDPVAGATVADVLLIHDDGNDGFDLSCATDTCWTFSPLATDSNGIAKYKLRHAGAGNYRFAVTGLTHGSLTWDPSPETDNPDTFMK